MGKRVLQVVVATAVTAAPLFAFADRPELESGVIYGISQDDGSLVRYEIYQDATGEVGKVRLNNGKVLTGIRASAYRQGYRTMVAFWTDPDDGQSYAVKVNLETGLSELCPDPIVKGSISGATAVRVPNADGGSDWKVFGVMQREVEAGEATGAAVSGVININPNNSPDNEFQMDFADGTTVTLTNGQTVDGITRDDLKDNLERDDEGVVFRGAASRIRIKPKGNGNANSMTLDGEAYAVQNGTTYEFEGTMQAVVWNDKVKNGKAMGKWWVSIDAAEGVTINGAGGVAAGGVSHELVQIDPDTGAAASVMTLDRAFDSLAGEPGGTEFYATAESTLYKIDTTAGSITEVGPVPTGAQAMEMFGDELHGFKGTNNKATELDTVSGGWSGAGYSIDLSELGTMIYVEPEYDPVNLAARAGFD